MANYSFKRPPVDDDLWSKVATVRDGAFNTSNWNSTEVIQSGGHVIFDRDAVVRIILYSTIFVMSICGNALVILTLAQNKRMRTVTNVFLINLAVSDFLLGVFCMPFTLVGSLLRDFIFGELMCKLIPYLQAVSVSVSVWTLVSISLERFFAICRPLHSRKWQTVSHAKRIILLIWVVSFLHTVPIAALSRLIPLRIKGKHKCREVWPNVMSERTFNLYLDVVLLGIPLIIMSLVYALIIRTLNLSFQVPKLQQNSEVKLEVPASRNAIFIDNSDSRKRPLVIGVHNPNYQTFSDDYKRRPLVVQRNYSKSQASKRRVIYLLCVIILEFFICWTPLHVTHTWSLFDPKTIYSHVGSTGISIIQLLAYISSCCNPVTYCFMHKKFRHAFLSAVRCRPKKRWASTKFNDKSVTMNSICSVKGMTIKTELLESDSM